MSLRQFGSKAIFLLRSGGFLGDLQQPRGQRFAGQADAAEVQDRASSIQPDGNWAGSKCRSALSSPMKSNQGAWWRSPSPAGGLGVLLGETHVQSGLLRWRHTARRRTHRY
jgi:hypothetical protein